MAHLNKVETLELHTVTAVTAVTAVPECEPQEVRDLAGQRFGMSLASLRL
jgi:hypothetical protein